MSDLKQNPPPFVAKLRLQIETEVIKIKQLQAQGEDTREARRVLATYMEVLQVLERDFASTSHTT